MRLKGRVTSLLKKKDDKTATFTIEVELPTSQIIHDAGAEARYHDWHCKGKKRESGKSNLFQIPNEIIVHFFDDANDKEILSQLTRRQLKGILLKAVEDGKLSEEIIFSYEGGSKEFTDDEVEVIRTYIKLDTPLLTPKKLKSGRMLRPKN
jgi:hypothetical protein